MLVPSARVRRRPVVGSTCMMQALERMRAVGASLASPCSSCSKRTRHAGFCRHGPRQDTSGLVAFRQVWRGDASWRATSKSAQAHVGKGSGLHMGARERVPAMVDRCAHGRPQQAAGGRSGHRGGGHGAYPGPDRSGQRGNGQRATHAGLYPNARYKRIQASSCTCNHVARAPAARAGAHHQFKVQVYIAVHATHGTRAFFPHNGLRRGKQDSHSDVELWTSKLTDKQRDFIISKSYYNQEAALEKFKQRASPARQALFKADDFDPMNFLVRLYAFTKTLLYLSCTAVHVSAKPASFQSANVMCSDQVPSHC